MKKNQGLTAMELVVVLLVISLLIVIIVPSKMGPSSRMTPCLSNLRQQGLSFFMYTSSNSGHLPSSNAQLRTLCDQPVEFRNALLQYMGAATPGIMQKKVFYCPDNSQQNPLKLWDSGKGVSTWGYMWFNDRGGAEGELPANFPGTFPPLSYHANAGVKNAANIELAQDVVVSDGDAGKINFFPTRGAVTFGSGFHENSGKTKKICILFLDGHSDIATIDPVTSPRVWNNGQWFWFPP